MINRIGYTLKMAWRYRKALMAYRNDPVFQIKSVLEMDVTQLRAQGTKALILDFDGVLATYGEVSPEPELESWLNACIQTFGSGNVLILSNKATQQRVEYFAKYFKGIVFFVCQKKKPYPDGLLEIKALTQFDSKELLIVDDRLLTGILAAIITNTPALYLTPPLFSLRKKPIQELFFMGLRALERMIYYQKQ